MDTEKNIPVEAEKETHKQRADRVLKAAHEMLNTDTLPTDVVAETARNLLYATCNSFDNAEGEDQKRYAAVMVLATEVIIRIVDEKIEEIIAASEAKDD